MFVGSQRGRQDDWQVRPLGAEARFLAQELSDSPFLDARFLHDLVDRDLIENRNGREVWTAWLGGNPVGFLILDPGPDARAELTLAVLARVRRQGLGRRLVEFAQKRGAKEGWSWLTLLVGLDNPVGQAFFRALGFEEVPTQLGSHLCMRRRLDPPDGLGP